MKMLIALVLVLMPFSVGLAPVQNRARPARMSYLGKLNLTTYHAVEEQTDDNPFETADGTTYRPDEIADVRVAAMSEEFLARSGGPVAWGDLIYIAASGELGVVWYVHDSMSASYYSKECDCNVDVVNFVDLLVTEDIAERWYDVPVYHISGGQAWP